MPWVKLVCPKSGETLAEVNSEVAATAAVLCRACKRFHSDQPARTEAKASA